MRSNFKGVAALILTAVIWGFAFAAQGTAAEHLGAFTFNAARSLLTFLTLGAVVLLRGRRAPRRENAKHWALGAACGLVIFGASTLQQMGLSYTTAGKSGFITAMYIVLVPIFGLFFGRRVRAGIWGCVALSVAGMLLLSMDAVDSSIGLGEWLTLGCAVVFSAHILMIDRYAGELDSIRVCCIQFGVAGALSLIAAFLFEEPRMSDLAACWTSIAYVGVFSGAIAYTLQIWGQKTVSPALASLIMCLESVFAALGGWLILGQTLAPRELAGCALLLLGCVLAQALGNRPAAKVD